MPDRATKRTVAVDPETHRRLAALAAWNESLDAVICRLLDEHEQRVRAAKR